MTVMVKALLKNQNTWLNYLETFKERTNEQEDLQLGGFDDFFNTKGFVNSFFKHSVPYMYLLDYRRGKYINMSDNFGGYKSEAFLNNGIGHTLEIYHPDHLKVFDKKIFPERLQILKGINPQDHKNYIFSYNLSIKNRNGLYEEFIQRNCFLSDEAGNPIMSMGILIHIDQHQYDNRIIQTVDRINYNGTTESLDLFKNVFYLNEEDKIFTKREKEVMLYMADGLSSKMIADKLHISENTIINHRRNMQEKSNMPNCTALVSYAIRKGII